MDAKTDLFDDAGRGYRIDSSGVVMLDIRPSAGGAVGFPYSSLEKIQFAPPASLTLTFADCEIKVEGNNLLTLYEYLLQHSIAFIRVSTTDAAKRRAEPFIKRIEIKPSDETLRIERPKS